MKSPLRAVFAALLLLASGCHRRSREELSDPFAVDVSPARVAEFVRGVSLDGRWQTVSGACGGAGATDLEMVGVQRAGSFELTYPQGDMLCTLQGRRCEGTWRGRSGAGWFQIAFTPDGAEFSGTWGYGTNRATTGRFTGRRAS